MPARLRLISWNLHGPPFAERRSERMRAATAEMIRRAPDVALLQEIWFRGDAARLIDQFGSGYDPVDVPDGALLGRKGGLLAFLRKSSPWSLASEDRVARFEEFTAEASPLIFWQGDGLGDKGIQVLELRHAASGQGLFVLNTHLQAQYRGYPYEKIRRAQISQLNAVASGLDHGVPVLAAGDLNTLPQEAALYARLTSVWHDLTAEVRQQCSCGTNVPAATGGTEKWIDYVLARRNVSWTFSAHARLIRNAATDDPFSDHQGLDASIEMGNTASGSLGTRALAALVLRGPSSRRAWLAAGAALLLDALATRRRSA